MNSNIGKINGDATNQAVNKGTKDPDAILKSLATMELESESGPFSGIKKDPAAAAVEIESGPFSGIKKDPAAAAVEIESGPSLG